MSAAFKKITVNMLDKLCQKFVEQVEGFVESPIDSSEFVSLFNEIPCNSINKKWEVSKDDNSIISKFPAFSHATSYNADYLLYTSVYYKRNVVSGLYPYYSFYSSDVFRSINPNQYIDDFDERSIYSNLHTYFPNLSHTRTEQFNSALFGIPTEDLKDYIQAFSSLFIGVMNLGGNSYDYTFDRYVKRKPTMVTLEKFSKSTLKRIYQRLVQEKFLGPPLINGYEVSSGVLPIVFVEDSMNYDNTKVCKVQKDLIYYEDSYYLAGVFKNKPEGNYTKEDYSILISSSLFTEEKLNHFSRIVTKYYLPLLLKLNPELKVEILSHNEVQKRLSTNNFITKTNSDVRRALLELS